MKIFLIGETSINQGELADYLAHREISNWRTDGTTDSATLTEIYSRGCYNSFAVDGVTPLNANLTMTRSGNSAHLANICAVGHGSVMEHASLNFMFCDVSRVLTHELVRHRVGIAISQESLRYVRLGGERIREARVPAILDEYYLDGESLSSVAKRCLSTMADWQSEMGAVIDGVSGFAEKKLLQSAIRRIAPMGVMTNIGWTTNFNNLRHVLVQRTSVSAEEEIRSLFLKVWDLVSERYPALMSGLALINGEVVTDGHT